MKTKTKPFLCEQCENEIPFASELEREVYKLTHPSKITATPKSNIEVFYQTRSDGTRIYHWHEV